MELGLYTFVPAAVSPEGRMLDADRRLEELLEQAVLAEQVGLDVIGVGEHHRPDFVVSTPAVVLAAIAARTSRVRLTSAVTVLSSDDPVRVFQEFATLDLLSKGRAEITAGRGSFIESFPLFGYDLDDYHELFAEKLELLLALRAHERVTWRGEFRAPLHDQAVYPRPLQHPLPVWIAVGGTPQSVARAAQLGLPLAIAIIGGQWRPFEGFTALYRDLVAKSGHQATARLSINSHGIIAESRDSAIEAYWPNYFTMMGRIGRERGWPPPTRAKFEAECGPAGALFVGDPEQIAAKIAAQHRVFGHDRFTLQMSLGPGNQEAVLRSIELFGTKVKPMLAQMLSPEPATV
ncbi:MAG: LLM class flavin-dependent oxidoreductase [Gemmatimonadaceae bacterium]|jgi:probable LLM family oxidoreductase|nr:LLM class flavin-dependent oxidoreductase [Gemmatimonadaceae bacterium]